MIQTQTLQTQCPTCGAPLQFQSAHSILAVCGYCQSSVIRRDLDLAVIGKMSAIREDHTPLQIDARGAFEGTPFRVVGRRQVRFDEGFWNEWYIILADGRDGWIGETNGQLTVLFEQPPSASLPPFDRLRLGDLITLGNGSYQVSEKRTARVVAAQGELPSDAMPGAELPFADLQTASGRFATLDYATDANRPQVYAGVYVRLADLKMTGLRTFERFAEGRTGIDGKPLVIEPDHVDCPSCGARVEVHLPGQTIRVGCQGCGALLSHQDERVKLMQAWRDKVIEPDIPIGSRGVLGGVTWEILGAILKSVKDEWGEYPWWEYLLFNPYEGYRWLVQANGHFTFMEPCLGLPQDEAIGFKRYQGVRFKKFQNDEVTVKHVLGELYWQVSLGETTRTADFIAPPHLLSREGTDLEQVWSVGTYIDGAEVWTAFKVRGAPPAPEGVAPNQPYPYTAENAGVYQTFKWLALALIALTLAHAAVAKDAAVVTLTGQTQATVNPAAGADVVISEPFTVTGRSAVLKVDSRAELNNQWLYLTIGLHEQNTGEVISTTHLMERWSGDGWSEGEGQRSRLLGPVKAGTWVMQVTPRTEPGPTTPISWTVRGTWDTRRFFPSVLALLALALGPLLVKVREMSFEHRRWNPE